MMNTVFKAALLWLLSASCALAQSSPNLRADYVPTPTQWNGYFAAKQDVLGYVPLSTAGGVMLGRLVTSAPSTTAGFNLTPGSAPSAPVNGDVWSTSAGIFARINSSTVGPLSGSVSSVSVVSANGLAGTVATATSTPAITLSTTITGVLKGNGTAISAAAAGTDFSGPTSALATGILKSTTGTGALTIATGADLPAMSATVGGAVPTPPNNTTTYLRGDGTFATPAGGGTVTTASVVSANGFAGTVATATSTPAFTLTTTITGVLKGNGTAISAATAGTDFVTGSSTNTFTNKAFDTAGTGNSFSINGVAATANTGTGAVARAAGPVFTTPTLGVALATSINGNAFTTGTGTLNLQTFTATIGATDTYYGITRLINTQTGTTYTLVLTDAGKLVTLNNAGAITLTIPLNASVAFPIGAQIDLIALGAGQVTVTPTGGVLIVSESSHTKLSLQGSPGTLVKTGTDTWVLVGSLS